MFEFFNNRALKGTVNFLVVFTLTFGSFSNAYAAYEVDVSDDNTVNADCFFYYDVLASDSCKDLYDRKGIEGIGGLMAEPEVFNNCIMSNCGLYSAQTNADTKNTYTYNMETIKECIKVDDRELSDDELVDSAWFTSLNPNITDKPELDVTTETVKTVPFKIIQYKCPSYVEEKCVDLKRVTQTPVMCTKSGTSTALAQTISKCLNDHDPDACTTMKRLSGGVNNYISWMYCDEDADGDGFPERLSPEMQNECGRSDASNLRCYENSTCNVIASCVEEGIIADQIEDMFECNDMNRHFTEHEVNTECGNMTDVYRDNMDCVRINSVTEMREESEARVIKVASGVGRAIDDYTEYVVYRKKEDFQHDTILAALFFPQAYYNVQKGFNILGFDISKVFGVFGGEVKAVGTVLDSHIEDTQALGYTVRTNDEVKGITYKTKKKKKSFGRVKYYTWAQKAWWTEEIVPKISTETIKASDWVWQGYKPLKINYKMDVKLEPNDLLMVYDINTRPSDTAATEVLVQAYGDEVGTCEDATQQPVKSYKPLLDQHDFINSKEEITKVGMIFPYTGTYTFKFYDNERYLFSQIKHFGKDNTGNDYPEKNVDIFNPDGGGVDVNSQIDDATKFALEKIIKDAVDHEMVDTNTTETIKTLIDAILDAMFLKNNQKFKGEEEQELSEFAELALFTKLMKYLVMEEYVRDHYYSENDECATTVGGDPSTESTSIDDNTLENLKTEREDYILCLSEKEWYNTEVNRRVNSFLETISNKRFSKVDDLTTQTYSDFEKVIDNVNKYLDKQPTTTISTSLGSWNVSFKSKCGDYAEAIDYANSNFLDGLNKYTTDNFRDHITLIKNELVELIEPLYDDVSLSYSITALYKEGTSSWDDWHYREAGTYSCEYDCGQEEPCVESGACYTSGETGRRCKSSCDDYIPAHYGENIDIPIDEEDDQDNSCTEQYYWYESNDHFRYNSSTSGSYKLADQDNGTTVQFNSAGAYSCDALELRPNGTEDSECRTSGHDLIHDYEFSEKVFDAAWKSTAVKLSVSSARLDELEQTRLTSKKLLDSEDTSTYFNGDDDIRVGIATAENKIKTDADKWVILDISNALNLAFREYIQLQFENNYMIGAQGSIIFDKLDDALDDIYDQLTPEAFQPFNRIRVEDSEAIKGDPNAVNFDITFPGGLYVNNHQSFNFMFVPFKEKRLYRCYDEWDICSYANEDNCVRTEEKFTTIISDGDGKTVPIAKKEEYQCEKSVSVSSCTKWDYKTNCHDFYIDNAVADYDDNDFTNDFFKGVGQAIAVNQSTKIFGAAELSCEDGLFTDYSWLQDPSFWMAGFSVLSTNVFPGVGDFMSGAKAWAGNTVEATKCATEWSNCMNNAGASITDVASNMFTAPTTGGSYGSSMGNLDSTIKSCDIELKNTANCASWSGLSDAADAIEKKLADSMSGVADTLGFQSGGELMEFMGDPLTALMAMTVFNLATNTFDDCNQCKDLGCAEDHDPKEAIRLLKLTDALDPSNSFTGSKYGLGPSFKAHNQCFYKDSGCAMEFLKSCVRDYHNYCCYNGRMTRILVGQIYQQMGWKFQSDGCDKIKLATLEEVDFTPCPPGNPIPSRVNQCVNYEEIKDYILNQTNWDASKRINLNDEIQGVLDATSSFE